MNYNYLIKNRVLNCEKLLQYGFVPSQEDQTFDFRRDLYNGLYLQVRVSPTRLEADVYDELFNQKYAPFASGHGGAAIKSQVREILQDILAVCTLQNER